MKSLDLRGRWERASRRARWVLITLAVLIVLFRLLLPYGIERYVNRELNRGKDYGGRIGRVSVQILQGSYRIYNPEIFKRSGEIRAPLFAASQLQLSIQWRELFHGSVVGEVVMLRPHVNFVSGPTAEQTQTGTNEGWNVMLEHLFPFKLNRLEIKNGEIHFQNEHSKPPVDISLKQLSATATNLSNSRDVKSELPAGVTAHGSTIGGGGLDLQVQLDPLANLPTYQMTMQLTNVDLVVLNDFLKAYGKFDVEKGEFALFASVASKEGNYDGYLKVFFNHLDVFAWEKERQKNALQIFWEAIVGTLATAFKNQPKDSLATRIPISGSYQNSKIGTWTAVATLLRNAFIRALVPKLDEHITVQEVKIKDVPKSESKEQSPKPSGKTPPMTSSSPPEKGATRLIKPN